MIHAYDEQYLYDAQIILGEAFDYAVNTCGLKADEFLDFFINGGIASSFGKGHPKYVAGVSGIELVMDSVEKSGQDLDFPVPIVEYRRTREYWGGWILAYYQWYTGRPFKDIRAHISMEKILQLYNPLHEASEEKFVDTVNALITKEKTPTKLHLQREQRGISQRELAEKSGVNLRTLQQYESRAKDIDKAAVQRILAMANVLGCQIEDLMEFKE